MRNVMSPLFGLAVAIAVVSPADAACTGPGYDAKLGQQVRIHRISNGSPCIHTMLTNKDKIYGNRITRLPKYGTLSAAGRTQVIYRPKAGFKGEDSYSFQWIGKQNGVTPSAITISVSVSVR